MRLYVIQLVETRTSHRINLNGYYCDATQLQLEQATMCYDDMKIMIDMQKKNSCNCTNYVVFKKNGGCCDSGEKSAFSCTSWQNSHHYNRHYHKDDNPVSLIYATCPRTSYLLKKKSSLIGSPYAHLPLYQQLRSTNAPLYSVFRNNMNFDSMDEGVPLQLFEICLNRDEYFPGEVMTGKLLLVTSRPFTTEGIFIKFEGIGAVKWKTRSAHFCGLQKAEFVQEKRKYFTNVFRYDMDSLPEGSSVLTFEFEVPTGIPQSIEAGSVMRQLKILYSVEALIRTSTEDFRQEQNFRVKSILNLNGYPELSLPVCKTLKEHIFESCWSSSGRVLGISFSIKKQGFVPGEKVKAELVISNSYNNAEAQILGVEIHLIQEVELRIRDASRVRRRILAKNDMMHVSNIAKKGKSCSKTDQQQRTISFSLNIPEDILISYGNLEKQVYDFISIRYFIRMSMEQSSFPYKPLQIHLPIKVGTVFVKEQKMTPILLLAPVPLVLPRPRAPIIEAENKQTPSNIVENAKLADLFPTAAINSLPEIIVTSKSSLAIAEQATSSNNGSPRTPKRKPGNAVVGDSSSSLCKPQEAFKGKGIDSDSESFRSGVEELSRI